LGPDLVDQAQGYLEFGDDHAWLFAMPNGRVFHAGPASQMNFFDPAARTWTPAGTRGIDPYSINGVAVMTTCCSPWMRRVFQVLLQSSM
jgi:galactose oxidase